MEFKTLQDEIVAWSTAKGWDFPEEKIPEKLMMAVGELSEAMQEYRTGHIYDTYYTESKETPGAMKPEGMTVELADAVIRILNICGHLKLDIVTAIQEKMAYNQKRPYRHGNLKA